jgi:hypothetical protein
MSDFYDDSEEYNENEYNEFDYDEFNQRENEFEYDEFNQEEDRFQAVYKDIERTGFARPSDIDETLGTFVEGEKFNRIELQTRTPEDIFRAIVNETARRYEDITGNEITESLRIMQRINNQDKKLKYKNPKAILFAILVFNIRGEIDRRLLDQVYEKKAKNEDISKIDLLRYAFFIKELRQN